MLHLSLYRALYLSTSELIKILEEPAHVCGQKKGLQNGNAVSFDSFSRLKGPIRHVQRALVHIEAQTS